MNVNDLKKKSNRRVDTGYYVILASKAMVMIIYILNI